MESMASVLNIMALPLYKDMAASLAAKANMKLLSIDENCLVFDVQSLVYSGLTCTKLAEVLTQHSSRVEAFVTHKNAALLCKPDVQDYPVGREVEDDHETIEGISASFLLAGLVEFCLPQHSKEALWDYLKKSRIPQAKQYAQSLQTWLTLAHSGQAS